MKLTQEDHHWLEAYRQAFAQQFPGMVEHIIVFGAVLIRPSLIEAEWAGVLAREPDRRLLADESLHVLWGPEASSRLVEDARVFIQRIQEYLVSVEIALG